MFGVFDDDKPADFLNHNVHESWSHSVFPTKKEAQEYAINWLRIYDEPEQFPDRLVIEIREVQKGKNVPTPKKKFKVVSVRDEADFEIYINNPTDGYVLHSWNVVHIDVNHYEYIMVFRLVEPA
jgi:hypothetical protein